MGFDVSVASSKEQFVEVVNRLNQERVGEGRYFHDHGHPKDERYSTDFTPAKIKRDHAIQLRLSQMAEGPEKLKGLTPGKGYATSLQLVDGVSVFEMPISNGPDKGFGHLLV